MSNVIDAVDRFLERRFSYLLDLCIVKVNNAGILTDMEVGSVMEAHLFFYNNDEIEEVQKCQYIIQLDLVNRGQNIDYYDFNE